MKIRTLEIICFISLFICVVISCVNFDNDCNAIRENVLRLHVIANSDSTSDQNLKLTVRDELLKSGSFAVSNSKNKTQAKKAVTDNLEFLRLTAQKTVYDEGYGYDVKVEVTKSYFPTRQYDDITLPAGYYDAVKVVIGEGEGENWWCVMFPCLCLPAATKDSVKLGDVLNSEQMEIIESEEKYEIRFWLLEKYYELFKKQ